MSSWQDAASIVSIFRAMSKVSVSVQSLRATGVAKACDKLATVVWLRRASHVTCLVQEANHVFFRNNPDIQARGGPCGLA